MSLEDAAHLPEIFKKYFGLTTTCFLGTVLSILCFFFILEAQKDRVEHRFIANRSTQVELLKEQLKTRHEEMEMLAQFFMNSEHVTRDEFNAFLKPLFRHKTFKEIAWATCPLGNIRLCKITYIVSSSKTQPAFVISSLFHQQDFERTALKALQSASAITTEPLSLNKELVQSQKFLAFFHPVQRKKSPVQQEVTGLLIGVLDINAFFEQIIPNASVAFNLYVFDTSLSSEERLLYSYQASPHDQIGFTSSLSILQKSVPFSFATDNIFPEKKWAVAFTPTKSLLLSASPWEAWLAFILGLALTAVLAVFVFHLISRRLEVERLVELRTKELKLYTHKLERSNEELDEFAYIVSHDLKEPLRGISNYVHFILEDYDATLPEEAKSKLHVIERLAQRVMELTHALLDYSRLGQTELSIKTTNIHDVIQEVLLTLEPMLHVTPAEITVQPTLPTVVCDSIRIREVFYNLITNGIKYNDKAPKCIMIGAIRRVDVPVFYVKDNGIGLAEKHYTSIFRIFKRLHGKDRYGEGTGVGLTIVKKIIERHGGQIWVESILGKGTTFYFTLGSNTLSPLNEPNTSSTAV